MGAFVTCPNVSTERKLALSHSRTRPVTEEKNTRMQSPCIEIQIEEDSHFIDIIDISEDDERVSIGATNKIELNEFCETDIFHSSSDITIEKCPFDFGIPIVNLEQGEEEDKFIDSLLTCCVDKADMGFKKYLAKEKVKNLKSHYRKKRQQIKSAKQNYGHEEKKQKVGKAKKKSTKLPRYVVQSSNGSKRFGVKLKLCGRNVRIGSNYADALSASKVAMYARQSISINNEGYFSHSHIKEGRGVCNVLIADTVVMRNIYDVICDFIKVSNAKYSWKHAALKRKRNVVRAEVFSKKEINHGHAIVAGAVKHECFCCSTSTGLPMDLISRLDSVQRLLEKATKINKASLESKLILQKTGALISKARDMCATIDSGTAVICEVNSVSKPSPISS